jgi:hypothetical protein
MLPWSSPVNGTVTLWTTPETLLTKVPPTVYSSTWADVLKSLGHASALAKVGVEVRAPVAGTSVRTPGSVPVAACAKPTVSKAAPAAMPIVPRKRMARRVVMAVRHEADALRRALEMV